MNWEALGAIGETLGAVAVFVTLGYLAVQVRHARDEVARSVGQHRSDTVHQVMTMQMDERMTPIVTKANANMGAGTGPFTRALMDRAGLTHEEAAAYASMSWAIWQYRAETIQGIDELSPSERIAFDYGTRANFDARVNPSARLFYETHKRFLNPEAVRYVDALLAQST